MGLSPRRLLAITAKELRHVSRDARLVLLVTLSPAFLLLILSYVFAFDAGRIGLALIDEDRSAASRAYLAAVTADGTFELRGQPAGDAEGEQMLLAGRADLLLVIPAGFQDDRLAGRPARVQAVVDGTDAIFASQAIGKLSAATSAFGATLAGRLLSLQVRTRVWYNGDLKSLWSMVPGLLGIVLVLPALALTLAIGREKETGTLEALIATPVTGVEYQLGKVLAYVLAGLVSAVVAAGVAVFWFGVPLRGSFLLYLALTVDFYLASMGVALLVARFMASQQTAMLAVLLIFFVPGFFIAGLISPVRAGSPTSTLTSYVLPVTHFIAIARGVFLKGVGVAEMWEHVARLTAIAVVSLAASLLLFRKRLD
ncbi:MAG TPA: ABC transporter permease [Anaerolineae bacterium]